MDPPLYPRPRIEYGEKVMIGGGRVKIWIPAYAGMVIKTGYGASSAGRWR